MIETSSAGEEASSPPTMAMLRFATFLLATTPRAWPSMLQPGAASEPKQSLRVGFRHRAGMAPWQGRVSTMMTDRDERWTFGHALHVENPAMGTSIRN